MMLRNGTVIIGNWDQDLLDGRALIFTSLGSKILAQFSMGKFHGWSMAEYKQKLLKCILFYENQLDGDKLTYDDS